MKLPVEPRLSPVTPRRRLHVITWGCQMNVYDSGRMADVLAPLGYTAADGPADADMVILNTCHIREKAAEKVFSELGRLRLIKEERAAAGKSTILAVAGCVAQAEGAEITARAPYVDIVLGPQTYHRLPEMVARAHRAAGPVIETDFPVEQKFDFLPEQQAAPGALTAFLTVQEGCDKFCSFCVVPYTRGAEASRPAASVLAEARRLVANGARELTLLGQNVNAYHGEGTDGRDWGLARLIRALAEIPGLVRLRYTTSHPRDMEDDLIAAHGDVPALMPFLHLPVQSGSDRILAAMNRKHTADDYRRLIDRLRARSPRHRAVVGLHRRPSRRDRAVDFAATMRLIERCRFRPGLSASNIPLAPARPPQVLRVSVPEGEKDNRLAELQALLRDQQTAFNAECTGRVIDVLVDACPAGARASSAVARLICKQFISIGPDDSDGGGGAREDYRTPAPTLFPPPLSSHRPNRSSRPLDPNLRC